MRRPVEIYSYNPHNGDPWHIKILCALGVVILFLLAFIDIIRVF